MHQGCSQGAIEPNTERPSIHHRDIEGLSILTRERSPSSINDRARNEQRKRLQTSLLKIIHVSVCAGAGIQCVKDGLDEYDVCTTLNQTLDLLLVRILEFVV